MYKNYQNSNIFIIDSDYKLHKTRGSNEKAFLFLCNDNLYKNPNNNLEKNKEREAIKDFKCFNQTAIPDHNNNKVVPPKIITMGKKDDGGSLLIHKPRNTIFYYQKIFDSFFQFSSDFLNKALNFDHSPTRSLIPDPEQLDHFLSNYISNIYVEHLKTVASHSTSQEFGTIDNLKTFLKNTDWDNQSFDHEGTKIQLTIDWETLGYQFKTYSAQDSQEFKQMAMDLTDSGIDLNEKEQDIWCNKLISLQKMNYELLTSQQSSEARHNFYETIKIKQEHRSLNEQVNQFNKKQVDYSVHNTEQTKKQPKTKML